MYLWLFVDMANSRRQPLPICSQCRSLGSRMFHDLCRG